MCLSWAVRMSLTLLLTSESKMLGLPLNKTEDMIAVAFPGEPVDITKRGILRFLAAVYDLLGIASPTILVGKLLYCEVCDGHLPLDKKVSDRIRQKWLKFVRNLPNILEVPWYLPRVKEPIKEVDLHATNNIFKLHTPTGLCPSHQLPDWLLSVYIGSWCRLYVTVNHL